MKTNGSGRRILRILLIVGPVVAAAYGSTAVFNAVQAFVLPPGQTLAVGSPREVFALVVGFMFWLCASVALMAGALIYLRSYRIGARAVIGLAPVLGVGYGMAHFKAMQVQAALAVGAMAGSAAPLFSARQVALHEVPAGGFVAGLLAVALAWAIRRRRVARDPQP